MIRSIRNGFFIGLLGFSQTVFTAPQPPNAGAIQSLEQQILKKISEEDILKKSEPIKPEIKIPGPVKKGKKVSDKKNIWVNNFVVDKSEILTEAEIQTVLEPFQQKQVSVKDLFDAIQQLNDLYVNKQYRTARAILPPQDVKEGVIKVRLIEARVGEIKVQGAQAINVDFIRKRIKQYRGELVSLQTLEKNLVRYNALYGSKLSASIAAGAAQGTTDIDISVQEQKPTGFTAFVDNAGRDTTGKARTGLIYLVNNLRKQNDALQFLATVSGGSKSLAVSYATPVTDDDLMLDMSATLGNISVIEGSFVPLDVTGSSRDFSVGLTQPLSVELNTQWKAYGKLSARNSISEFSGLVQEDLDLTVLSLGIVGQGSFSDYAWSVDNSINTGLTYLGGEKGFSYYRANASLINRFDYGLNLISRAGLQYSFENVIPSGEQFQVGGVYTVRGFSEGLLSGRNGYFGSLELRKRLNLQFNKEQNDVDANFQGLVFVDHGAAFPYQPGNDYTKDNILTSVGFGVLMEVGKQVSGGISVAYPLEQNTFESYPESPKLHANIRVSWM